MSKIYLLLPIMLATSCCYAADKKYDETRDQIKEKELETYLNERKLQDDVIGAQHQPGRFEVNAENLRRERGLNWWKRCFLSIMGCCIVLPEDD